VTQSVASTADRGDSGASTSRVATGATCRFRRTPRPRSRWGRSGSSPRPAPTAAALMLRHRALRRAL